MICIGVSRLAAIRRILAPWSVSVPPTTRCQRLAVSLLLLFIVAACSGEPKTSQQVAAVQQAVAVKAADTASIGFPSFADNAGPPPGWTGPVFQLSQAFPQTLPTDDSLPFMQIDFRTNTVAYLQAVKAYILAGNINRGNDSAGNSLDWHTQSNPVRPWYNMPWRTTGTSGREFVHGLTREFPAAPHSLDTAQKNYYDTYARAIYNPVAGFTVGQVWPSATQGPDVAKASFSPGAVVAKILFTTADTTDVPEASGGMQWQANIYPNSKCKSDTIPGCQRVVKSVRLFQMDFAIKDPRAPITQWVFGTFVYDRNAPGTSIYDKMVPLGLMFGNDPEVTASTQQPVISESKILAVSMFEHLGCHKRLSGPVDNPKSSCMSCHMTAQHPSVPSVPVVDSVTACDSPKNAAFWRDLAPGTPFLPVVNGVKAVALDFSMEMTSAVQNYFVSTHPTAATPKLSAAMARPRDTSFYDVVRQQNQIAGKGAKPK